jgi:hypothetical protein
LNDFELFFDQAKEKNDQTTQYYIENQGEFPNEIFVRFSRFREQYLLRFMRSNEELTKSSKTANIYTNDGSAEDSKLVKHVIDNGQV